MHLGFVCLSVRLLAASALSLSLVAPLAAQQAASPPQDKLKQHETQPQDRYEPELNVLPEQAHAEGAGRRARHPVADPGRGRTRPTRSTSSAAPAATASCARAPRARR